MYAIIRFITINKNAGNDLYQTSLILIWTNIDPKSKRLSPKLPIKVSAVNCMEANKISAKLTFENPII